MMDASSLVGILGAYLNTGPSQNVPSLISETKKWLSQSTALERRLQLLSSSLYTLHNLVKANDNKTFFQNNDAKRLLDIYSGADSIQRNFPALLILSYIVDPENEIDLIQDKKGTIDFIITKLKECLLKPQGFTVQELVEGLDNLSLHPANKQKIMSTAVPVLFEILERGDIADRVEAGRTLAKWELYNEEDIGVKDGECGEIVVDIDESEAQPISETRAFVETLLCSLPELGMDNMDDVKDLLDATNDAIRKHPKHMRYIITDTLVDMDGVIGQ
ncbi:uncharacterized protein LOC144451303 [Glandiceps talaboti]